MFVSIEIILPPIPLWEVLDDDWFTKSEIEAGVIKRFDESDIKPLFDRIAYLSGWPTKNGFLNTTIKGDITPENYAFLLLKYDITVIKT